MAELGESDDPQQLVPGNAGAIGSTARGLRSRGDELGLAGRGLARIDTGDGWSGPAAGAFRAKFQGQPGKWTEAGTCFHQAADALDAYVRTLVWAQDEAAAAVTDWHHAQAATRTAQAEYTTYQQAGGTDPFTDPGAAGRTAAQKRLSDARHQLAAAGDAAATTVGAGRDRAPKKPGFWSKVGDFFSGVGAGLENAGGHVVNGLASFGNAMVHHPGDVAAAAAGAGMMVLGAGGEAGGLVLDATGVGAVIGIPANVLSAGVIAAGGGMVAAGVGDLTMHAMSDDQTSPARTDHTGSGGSDAASTAGRDVHGADRTAMRGVDVDHVWQNGDMYVQEEDGQIVKVLDNGNGTHDVVVRDMSNPTGQPTTVIKNATDKYVNNKIESGQWG
jgi:hypothetical protein